MQEQNRRGGLLCQLRKALGRAAPVLSRAGSYIGVGMNVLFRWAWVASLATWVFAYPLLRGRRHQHQIDFAYRSLLSEHESSSSENRTNRYQHQ